MTRSYNDCGRSSRQGSRGTRRTYLNAFLLFFDIQDELPMQDRLVFKGQQLVVPTALRKELIEVTHDIRPTLEWRDACVEPGRVSTDHACRLRLKISYPNAVCAYFIEQSNRKSHCSLVICSCVHGQKWEPTFATSTTESCQSSWITTVTSSKCAM